MVHGIYLIAMKCLWNGLIRLVEGLRQGQIADPDLRPAPKHVSLNLTVTAP
jgi:hypothetical protein